MIEKILLYLLSKKIRDTHQVTDSEYYELLKFKSREDVIKLLKVVMTKQMFNHWEARDNSEEQKLARGAANICKTLLDAHRMVMRIEEEYEDVDKKMSKWQQFKSKFKVY